MRRWASTRRGRKDKAGRSEVLAELGGDGRGARQRLGGLWEREEEFECMRKQLELPLDVTRDLGRGDCHVEIRDGGCQASAQRGKAHVLQGGFVAEPGSQHTHMLGPCVLPAGLIVPSWRLCLVRPGASLQKGFCLPVPSTYLRPQKD
jgi:hypothetical protein